MVGGLVALNMVPKGLEVKRELEVALPLASQVKAQILAGDTEAAGVTTAELNAHTAAARAQTTGRMWSALESVPIVGANLTALRVVSETADDLAADAIVPASNISLASLKPVDGRFDVTALTDLGTFLQSTIDAVEVADERLTSLESPSLLPQISSGIEKLSTTLDDVRPLLSGLIKPLSVLPDALGASGPRNYLMIFQGNSEARASGGNPAAMTRLTVADGKIDITEQATSSQFFNDRPDPIVPLDAETSAIYSDTVGEWIPNITATPHFPTTVELVKAYWAEEFGSDVRIDGVISFDPVGLSYLLGATGPVSLVTGEALTAANAVPLLLNEVYFRYARAAEQDAFFAAAAVSIFDAVKSGTGDPNALLAALAKSVDEGRLKIWSGNEAEQELIAGTRLQGALPQDNSNQTAVGVYFNDTTGSKMDYYVNASVASSTTQCESANDAPAFSIDVTLANVITREQAAGLPRYITGPYYQPGFIATDFVVYGPVGATIDSWSVNGQQVAAVSEGTHLGRPVVRINRVIAPGESLTISYKMTGVADSEYGPLDVQTTPMVRPTPVSIDAPGCKE
ncbi:DUF4012 domain-containing protein [Mycetocola manganoxydans]|uniref:DUF4012 domain-containing protein n=1 Tax=Mycetocola manganoxydans TaxID=699879 RepID=A0A3L7A0C5_9MICO|nr:DUF4012 domain-containing protein [Mycetocola manganoxydans]GHD41743.1 hypothetical protein GCM10008097_06860 [Mycetocola manganoxydans]